MSRLWPPVCRHCYADSRHYEPTLTRRRALLYAIKCRWAA